MNSESTSDQIAMNADDLYREEIFTDRKVGTIRRLVPVLADGSDDDGRPVLFVGQAQILTPMGAMPLSFDIDAQTLEDAIGKFAEAAEEAVHRTVDELQEMRREASSSIVIPEAGAGLGGAFPGAGGGKIQLP